MHRVLLCAAAALVFAACAANEAQTQPPAPAPAASASKADGLIPGGPFKPLPAAGQRLTRIAFGSCNGSEKPIPILRTIAAEKPDLYVYAGDNVYGDARAKDPSLPELKEAYRLLAASPDYVALREAAPIIATWDDHDYGLNDAGVEFFAKDLAKDLFEAFFEKGDRVANHEGVYDAYSFGPEGERVQILLLDTRWSRTELARKPERGPRGVYTQTRDPAARTLSDVQWAWLEQKLREPAVLRIVVSSIQVLADGHDFETWDNMPLEQQRLYDLIKTTGAKGLVFVSGDRHSAGLYRREGLLPYPAYEMTASALNRSSGRVSDEVSTGQLGSMYTFANYGMIDIDWQKRSLSMQIKDATGMAVRETTIRFAELGLS